MSINWSTLGQVRPQHSFSWTAPVASGAGNVNTTQADNPYGGFDPNTIDVGPFLEQQNQIQQMSLDPQSELRAREAENLEQATRAGLQARGLNTSPYGAGVEAKALGDFGIDWQNQQLGRAIQGAQGMTLLGNLQQEVANRGWQHQRELGESAFEYNPDLSIMSQGGGPQFSYTPPPQASSNPFGGMGQGWQSSDAWRASKSKGPTQTYSFGGRGGAGSGGTDRGFGGGGGGGGTANLANRLNEISPGAGGLSPYQQWRQSYYPAKAARQAARDAENLARDQRRDDRVRQATTRTYASRLTPNPAKTPMRGSDVAKGGYESWRPDPFRYVV